MSNHPITMISPAQMIQSSLATNNDQFSPSNSSTPPAAGQGQTSTDVSGGTEASMAVAPGTIAPDAYAMQSSDATSFIFGSTATGQAVAGNQYTTVDDTAKSALEAAITEDQMLTPIGERGARRPWLKKKKVNGKNDESPEEEEEETASTPPYSADATRILARAMEKGITMM